MPHDKELLAEVRAEKSGATGDRYAFSCGHGKESSWGYDTERINVTGVICNLSLVIDYRGKGNSKFSGKPGNAPPATLQSCRPLTNKKSQSIGLRRKPFSWL
jgi:hypothetical protein